MTSSLNTARSPQAGMIPSGLISLTQLILVNHIYVPIVLRIIGKTAKSHSIPSSLNEFTAHRRLKNLNDSNILWQVLH